MGKLIFTLVAVAALTGCARELGSAEIAQGVELCEKRGEYPEFEGYSSGRGQVVSMVTAVYCRDRSGRLERVAPVEPKPNYVPCKLMSRCTVEEN